MADIKQIKIGNTFYDIRDATLRKKNYTTWTCIQSYDSPGVPDTASATDLSLILNYTFFGLVCLKEGDASIDAVTLLGMWYLPTYTPGNAWTTDAEIHTSLAYCNASNNWIWKGTLHCTSTAGTCLYRGSVHKVTSSGNARYTGYLYEVWGLF